MHQKFSFKPSPNIRKCLGKILFYKALLIHDIQKRIEKYKICLQIDDEILTIENIEDLYSWDIITGQVKYCSIIVDIKELYLYKQFSEIRILILKNFNI